MGRWSLLGACVMGCVIAALLATQRTGALRHDQRREAASPVSGMAAHLPAWTVLRTDASCEIVQTPRTAQPPVTSTRKDQHFRRVTFRHDAKYDALVVSLSARCETEELARRTTAIGDGIRMAPDDPEPLSVVRALVLDELVRPEVVIVGPAPQQPDARWLIADINTFGIGIEPQDELRLVGDGRETLTVTGHAFPCRRFTYSWLRSGNTPDTSSSVRAEGKLWTTAALGIVREERQASSHQASRDGREKTDVAYTLTRELVAHDVLR